MLKNHLIAVFALINLAGVLSAQDCLDYYKKCSSYNGKTYQYDDNTSSYLLTEMESIKVVFEAIPGINYNIGICSNDFSLPLHFVILDEESTLLYNNKDDNYALEFNFSVNSFKKLNVVVNIDNECIENITTCSGCVGILIKKTIKERIGF